VTAEDLAAQFRMKLAIRDQLSAVHEMLNRLQRVRQQVDEWEARAKASDGEGSRSKEVIDAAAKLRESISAIEADLLQQDADRPKPGLAKVKEKLATLSTMIDESDDAPTKGAEEVFALLSGQVQEAQGRFQAFLAEDVARFGELVREARIPAIVP
jgi:hypothetical protein